MSVKKLFNKKTLIRLIIIIVLVPVIIYSIYRNKILFHILNNLLILIAITEYSNMAKKIYDEYNRYLLVIITLILLLFQIEKDIINLGMLYLVTVILISLVSLFLHKTKNILSLTALYVFPIFYIIIPMLLLVKINYEKPPEILLMLLLIVWCVDIFAYVFGNLIGKHKLARTISPNKTVEGFIGGSLIGMLIYVYFQGFPKDTLGIIQFLIILFMTFLGQIGDLFQSAIKRSIDIKDSGNIFPGHGGVLDRIDNLLICIPIYLVVFYW